MVRIKCFIVFCVALISIGCGGCATVALMDKVDSNDDVEREFLTTTYKNCTSCSASFKEIFSGYQTERILKDGSLQMEYLFPSALKYGGVIFSIQDSSGKLTGALHGIATDDIGKLDHVNPDSIEVNKAVFIKAKDTDAYFISINSDIAVNGLAKYDSIFYEHGYMDRFFYLKKGSRFNNKADWRQIETANKIGWRERSMIFSGILRTGYVVTVPVDFVTLPFQLFYFVSAGVQSSGGPFSRH